MNKRTDNKIPVHYGMPDYYKHYKTVCKEPVSRILFNEIVSDFNSKIVDLIINDNLDFIPTTLQFSFCIRKSKRLPRIEDGRLINTTPVDWKATNKLWDEDPEAKERKIRVRFLNDHSSKNVFRIKALKIGSRYTNRKFYRFLACRNFQRSLAARIFDPNQSKYNAFDAYQ